MAPSLVARTGLRTTITGVRVRATRAARGAGVSSMAIRATTARAARCGFVRSGLLALHHFIDLSLLLFVFRSWLPGRMTAVPDSVEVTGWCLAWAIAIPASSTTDSSLGNITHNLNPPLHIYVPGGRCRQERGQVSILGNKSPWITSSGFLF